MAQLLTPMHVSIFLSCIRSIPPLNSYANTYIITLLAAFAAPSTRTRGAPRSQNRGGRARASGRRASGNDSLAATTATAPTQPAQAVPQTPQKKRSRKAATTTKEDSSATAAADVVNDLAKTPRATRQSARILSRFKSAEPEPVGLQLPAKGEDEQKPTSHSNEGDEKSSSPDVSASTSQSNSFNSAYTPSSAVDASFTRDQFSDLKKEKETDDHSRITSSSPDTRRKSPRITRKRNASPLPEEGQNGAGTTTSNVSPIAKKSKLETVKESPSMSPQNNRDVSAAPAASEPAVADGLSAPQSAVSESPSASQAAPPSGMSNSPVATPSDLSTVVLPGRGRGGFAGRARGRGSGRVRGRGARGRGGKSARGRRLQPLDANRSPSPGPVIKQLRERQRELDRFFKKVAAAQRLALQVIASRSENRLVRDSKAHMSVKEYQEVMDGLRERLEMRQNFLKDEFDYYENSAKVAYEAEVDRLGMNFNVGVFFSSFFFSNKSLNVI